MGELLLEIAGAHTDVEYLVLCGHTHGAGEAALRENLRVWTGAGPQIEPPLRIFDIG
jgi:carbonic anhydrase